MEIVHDMVAVDRHAHCRSDHFGLPGFIEAGKDPIVDNAPLLSGSSAAWLTIRGWTMISSSSDLLASRANSSSLPTSSPAGLR